MMMSAALCRDDPHDHKSLIHVETVFGVGRIRRYMCNNQCLFDCLCIRSYNLYQTQFGKIAKNKRTNCMISNFDQLAVCG